MILGPVLGSDAYVDEEFQHALVAMDDLMTTMKPELTPEEDAELARFKSECMAR